MKLKFTDFLLEKKIVSEEDLEKLIGLQRERNVSLIEQLISSGYIDQTQALHLLSEYLKIPPLRIRGLNIPKEVLNLIPERVAREYLVLPIGKIGQTLTVVMADPLNVIWIEDLRKITACQINPIVALLSEIKEAISRYYAQTQETSLEDILKDRDAETIEMIKDTPEVISKESILRSLEEAPIIKFTDYLLKRAVEEKASDVLVEPLEKSARVRLRIDGVLRETERFPLKSLPLVVSRIKVMANLNIAEFRLPQEGRFRQKILNRDIDFRVSILPSSVGEKVALRILDKSATVLDINLLGFENDVLEALKQDSLKPHGLILVCGPTGCGKTTTLYSILNYVYAPQKNIVTVEDPIEYQLHGINQVAVNSAVNLTFARVLRAVLRQDPNIIMIGEIRDSETADIAIKSSLTGHLVLSTLHTTTSAGAVTRLINMGVEPFLLSSTLIGVLSQRLVRRLCPKCKEEMPMTENLREKYSLDKNIILYKAKGCDLCQHTGYKGRVALSEYLRILPKLRELINHTSSEPEIKREARLLGMRTLREDGILKINNGMTGLEEVLKVTTIDEPL